MYKNLIYFQSLCAFLNLFSGKNRKKRRNTYRKEDISLAFQSRSLEVKMIYERLLGYTNANSHFPGWMRISYVNIRKWRRFVDKRWFWYPASVDRIKYFFLFFPDVLIILVKFRSYILLSVPLDFVLRFFKCIIKDLKHRRFKKIIMDLNYIYLLFFYIKLL